MTDPLARSWATFWADYEPELSSPYGPCQLFLKVRPDDGNRLTSRLLDSDHAGLEADEDFLEALDGGAHAVTQQMQRPPWAPSNS